MFSERCVSDLSHEQADVRRKENGVWQTQGREEESVVLSEHHREQAKSSSAANVRTHLSHRRKVSYIPSHEPHTQQDPGTPRTGKCVAARGHLAIPG